jgi:hypothetical protein
MELTGKGPGHWRHRAWPCHARRLIADGYQVILHARSAAPGLLNGQPREECVSQRESRRMSIKNMIREPAPSWLIVESTRGTHQVTSTAPESGSHAKENCVETVQSRVLESIAGTGLSVSLREPRRIRFPNVLLQPLPHLSAASRSTTCDPYSGTTTPDFVEIGRSLCVPRVYSRLKQLLRSRKLVVLPPP